MKHTQGEWESVGIAVKNKRDEMFYHTDIICNGTIRIAKSSGISGNLALANARLIAAAPDLLAACEHVRDNLMQESPEVWEIEIACLDYAITKAEPQQADRPERTG